MQAKDKASGLPVWVVEVIDADPQAREKTARVKVAAPDQPVLPAGTAGMPFVPVEFTGLTVTPYVNQAGRLAYSVKAAGVRLAGRGGRGPQDVKGRGVSSGGGSFGTASLHIGTDWHVRCSTYPDTTPILGIDAGNAAVSVSIAARERITADAVAFARELARQAARFAADCERLHAAQHDQGADGDDGEAVAHDAA